MQLSDTEKKIVARLKKRQESWIRWRWGVLLSALVKIGCGIYCAMIADRFIHEPDFNSAMTVAIVIPIAYVMLLGGMGLLAYSFLNWNGKPETKLLVKLIDEARDDKV